MRREKLPGGYPRGALRDWKVCVSRLGEPPAIRPAIAPPGERIVQSLKLESPSTAARVLVKAGTARRAV